MSENPNYRLRYTQVFVICVVCSLLYVISQSLPGGIASFDENLPGRKFLIQSFTRLRLKIGDRVFAQGVVGKDGWLFYTGSRNMEFFQNVEILGQAGREQIRTNLQLLYDKLQQHNITLVVVIAPNKETVYPEKLPQEIQKIGTQSELDKLSDLLQQEGPPVLMDLRRAFQKGKENRQIYYQTDTHWNTYGSVLAYREIMKGLSHSYPELTPNKISRFAIRPGDPRVHDIAALIGANHWVETNDIATFLDHDLKWITYNDDQNMPMTVATSSDDKLPKLLLYGDSFGSSLVPLLAPHFSQSTFISNHSAFPDSLNFKEIIVTKPDIVILEFVERSQPLLFNFLNNFGLETK